MARWIERFSLEGKTALITGAAGGIGLEVAKVLADAGADIAALDRDGAGLKDVKAAVEGMGRRCATFLAELGDPMAPVEAARQALKTCGAIDILVNNAGIARIAPLFEASLQDWDETMAVNLRAPFLLSQALAPNMIARGGGKIINISSQASIIAIDGHASYSASKGGLNALTRVMALELAKHNIQVNAICPTIILTPLGELVWGQPEKGGPMLARTPAGRFGKPVDIADCVLYLASGASSLICGESLLVDGGFTIQ